MNRMFRQWRALFSIYFQDGIAYKASGLIWVLTDVATAVTMPLVWAAASAGGAIQGFDQRAFVLYYLTMLLISCFVTCHYMWEIAWEIKEGIFSTYLVRPIGYMQLMFVRNFAWRIVRTMIFLPLFLLLIWAYGGYLGGQSLYLGWETWVAILLGHTLSFSFVMALGMLALFVQEATAIFELYYVPMLFLSGQLFPIALLPDWARNLAALFPFYYTTGFPTEVAIGRIGSTDALQGIGLQVAWIGGSLVLQRVLWAHGLRHYTGVGM
ncbi:MAG TPA: ABC-2 family transporter protein [Fimbriimonadaceae bacterium]|nr:ABC-2 family transporter protein [Fimbriimonadaceae bacterium]HRJ96936.1 ABC-2 family transporter protein [Fimbriimonadaceae bacterium]